MHVCMYIYTCPNMCVCVYIYKRRERVEIEAFIDLWKGFIGLYTLILRVHRFPEGPLFKGSIRVL